MVPYVFVAFYTLDTRYEAEASRLKRSLDKLGIGHDVRGVPDLGSWQANTLYTATFIRDMMRVYDSTPIVYVDADAVIWSRPDLFDDLHGKWDMAIHYRKGVELLNGTIWIAPTPDARAIVADWIKANDQNDGRWDQKNLQDVLAMRKSGRVEMLPASYCMIFDIMHDDDTPPVIEHLQASRVCNETPGSTYRLAREARLQELGE